MKKRIVCVLLTLIMLVSLVPATALTASAASLKTSEAAITIMKKLAIFKKNCYQVPGTNEFRIGYGTICSEKHKTTYKNGKVENSPDAGKHSITQAQADQALRKLILDLDAKVNSFASSNSLTLSQCQHDALVLFTFDVGDSWMSGSGVVRSAIVSKASTNDLLKAMSDWASDQDDFRRRKIEVNMYKNGIYSDVTPSSFGTVTYNPDAGTIPQNGTGAYSVLFDTTKTSAHIPSPTRSGYKFMGWYSAQYDGTLVPSLTGSYNGKTLWAGWQATSVTANNANDLSYVHGINETLKVSQLVSLDVYSIPTKKNVKPFRTINKDTATVTAIKDFIDDDGNRWCKLSAAGDGWVLLKSSGQGGGNTEYTGGKINVTVTVTNAYVNRRANDSASSALTGSYKAGTKLKIVATNAAKTWGQVEENGVAVGWVALMYTDWSTVYDGSAPSDANNTTPIATATVTYNGYLNARSDPGVDNKIVGGFAKDTTVNVFEIRTVNGHRWGRTSTGWICLTYTNVKMLTDKNVSDTGVLDYAFEVTLVNSGSDLPTYAQPTTNSNNSDTIKAGTTGLKITNAAVADGLIWVKAHWTVKETDKDGKTKVIAKSGWATYSNFNLVPTKFTVVSDSLNIRKDAGSGNEFVFKLTKGVEVEVHEIKLVGEEIWGKIVGYTPTTGSGIENYDGWINLASNYVKRSSKIAIDGGTKAAIGTGTVVNADSVRIRITGALYGQVLGSINRGTKVAVLGEKDGWYMIDYDVDNNKETDSWIYSQYLEVKMGVVESGTGSTGGTGTTQKTDGTGKGIIANTYAGVNVRSGAGIANAIVGKILNGTEVTILEVKLVGAAKWGRVKQGWICMDYVTMISYDNIPGNNSNNSGGNKGTGVSSFDEVERTTTTAVYTGSIKADTIVYKTPNPNLENNTVRTIGTGENITIHELTAVTLEIYEGDKTDKQNENNDIETVVKQTSYWARINDGWIKDPDANITLNALDEKVHTLTGASELNVRKAAGTNNDSLGKLKKGDQVPVTKLEIVKDSSARTLTVWGRVETSDGIVGYCDLSYMSEGALYEKKEEATTPTTPSTPTIGSTGNTGTGGFVNNAGGYKYTGKVINTESLNVRVTASTGAKKATTLKKGANLVIYETKISEDMAWGRCDAGWVYLYYVDLTPAGGSSAIDARVVYTDNTIIYTDNAASSVAGTYSRMSVIDIYEYVGDMARTDLGWVSTGNLL
ncbi:MAG: hypothetical protein EGQ46_03620 [Clostridiales bacterium]|nr:hypothetical protein [Clostridiales bacterium]